MLRGRTSKSKKLILHRGMTWVSAYADYNGKDYVAEFYCSRCGERQVRQYCCLDRVTDIGLEAFAKLHVGCKKPLGKSGETAL